MNKRLAICYRVYPGISKTPAVFADNKLKMTELCLASIAESLNDIDYHFFAIMDNCPNEYIRIFEKYFPAERLTMTHTNGIGNGNTFALQIKTLLQQSHSETIMFCEDDYFFLPEAIDESLTCLSSPLAPDFISPFDHADYYYHPIHRYHKLEYNINNRVWRNTGSACLTFITTKRILSKTQSVFLTYQKNNYDTSIWFVLTKIGIRKLFLLIISSKERHYAAIAVKMLLLTPKHFFWGKKYTLFSPVPTLCTHLETKDLSPEIEWKEIFDQAKNKIKW